MFKIAAIVGLLMAICISPVVATVYRVPQNFESINDAISASSDGDTVLVAPGIYAENIDYLGRNIVIKSSAGPETTFIEPDSIGLPIIILKNHESPLAILEGFTIRNSVNASAVKVDSSGITLKQNIFTNDSSGQGGAINASNGGLIEMVDNIFKNNYAYWDGGAVYSDGTVLWASGNKFLSNSAYGRGGALCERDAENYNMHHNLFQDNSCGMGGGAVYIDYCNDNSSFYNNTLVNNSAGWQNYGGGIDLFSHEYLLFYNNIITGNIGVGMANHCLNPRIVPFYNNVWGNTSDYLNINPGEGSISADPLFEGGNPFSFNLTLGSPCIDDADPSSPIDPDGTRADMGAFYFHHETTPCPYTVGDINGSEQTNSVDVLYGVSYFRGGNAPPVRCDMCPQAAPFYAAGDVNGSCSFNGVDISYLVAYFKGGQILHCCAVCPPSGR
jgi:hypothetical protein